MNMNWLLLFSPQSFTEFTLFFNVKLQFFFPNVPNLFIIFSPSLPFHLLPPSSCTLFSLPYLPLGIFTETTFICHLLAPPLETPPSSFLYFTYVFSPSSWVTFFFFFYRCNQNLFLLYICMHIENIFLLCIRI